MGEVLLTVGFTGWAGPAVVILAAVLASGCADSKEVNASFSQNRVSWFVFDTDRPDGLAALAGFEQTVKVVWVPRPRAVRVTDQLSVSGAAGVLAVSRMGLLVVQDADGTLTARRPGAQLPLTAYQTDRLFTWRGKVFLTLSQELPAVLPPVTLAWWSSGQSRLAFLPVPSQIRDPSRQAVAVEPPSGGTSLVSITWKHPAGPGVAFDYSLFALDGGAETPASAPVIQEAPAGNDPAFDASRARLADRLGAGVPSKAAVGPGPRLLFTEAGWVAVGKANGAAARLYKLPDLGVAGRYTGALALARGFVFTWETSTRGYVGAAGLVHVPFAVLAP